MNEPRRFLDDESAPHELRRLLRAAEPPGNPDPARLARSRRRVMVLATLPAVGGGLVLVQKLALGALLGSVVTVGVHVGQRVLDSALPAPSAVPVVGRPVGPGPTPTARVAEPVPAPPGVSAAPESPLRSVAPSAPPPPSADAGVTRELALLEAARRVVESDPKRALALLEQHAREAPRGTLAIERELLVIQALARSGRRGEAQARADRFRAAHPESLYEERITRLLEQGEKR